MLKNTNSNYLRLFTFSLMAAFVGGCGSSQEQVTTTSDRLQVGPYFTYDETPQESDYLLTEPEIVSDDDAFLEEEYLCPTDPGAAIDDCPIDEGLCPPLNVTLGGSTATVEFDIGSSVANFVAPSDVDLLDDSGIAWVVGQPSWEIIFPPQALAKDYTVGPFEIEINGVFCSETVTISYSGGGSVDLDGYRGEAGSVFAAPSSSTGASPASAGAAFAAVNIGGVTLTATEVAEYNRIRHAFNTAISPPGTGGGWLGNIFRFGAKCNVVHESVMDQVETKLKAGPENFTIVPVSISSGNKLQQHIYMGIAKKTDTGLTLISWTDPWANLDGHYVPSTGRHRASHTLQEYLVFWLNNPDADSEPDDAGTGTTP
jgi:hypothetical protein